MLKTILSAIWQAILDFSKELDVPTLDKVTIAFFSGVGAEVRSTALFLGISA